MINFKKEAEDILSFIDGNNKEKSIIFINDMIVSILKDCDTYETLLYMDKNMEKLIKSVQAQDRVYKYLESKYNKENNKD